MRTRSMRKKRLLDELPPELLSLVLSQMLPQDMMVQKCSRRWRDKDLDVLYWKPLFLNTFGEAAQTAAQTTKWRDRYERAWRLRVDVSREPGTGALGLHLGRFLSSYDHRVRPTNIFHATDGQGVLSVPDIRGKELELRYYIHDEGIPVGAFEVDVDVWVHPDDYVDDDVDDDAEDPVSEEYRWIEAGILKGLVVYNPLGTLYDPERPAVGRRGIRVGSPLRHLLEAYGVDLEDVEAYGDSRCGSLMGLRGVNIQFGLADNDDYTLWDQWEELLDGAVTIFRHGEPDQQREVPRETLLNWPLQSLQVWSDDAF
ncbi:unnamed protein product [Pelagomonas calceolata]|uniref:F-box domain-containing protein n=2 Tax=Pelagomonas calceolata TaxID=35677 RepID=A0A8J2S8P1_9STRA|nr:unnamed protein product [Pelagomonas calceolata]